jgi:HEPN domain-containing protein
MTLRQPKLCLRAKGLFMLFLNEASIPTRYPEDISRLTRQYNKQVAQRYLKETKALLRWLKTKVR